MQDESLNMIKQRRNKKSARFNKQEHELPITPTNKCDHHTSSTKPFQAQLQIYVVCTTEAGTY